MSEIERAIDYFEKKIKKNDRAVENYVAPFAEEAKRQWAEIDRPIGELALKILRAELDREKNEPLTLEEIKELADVCGLIVEKKEEMLDEDVEALIAERQAARKAKNFARADEIRDELLERGIILEDTREGVKWKRA